MGTTIIAEGAELPISVAMEDGNTGVYPRATLFSPSGTILGIYDLVHRSIGVYTITGVAMPAETFVTVLYVIYDDAGHTTESATYLRSSEVFALASYIQSTTVVDGTIDVQTALARLNSMAAGKIVQTLGNRYAYRNESDTVTLFTNEDNTTERTPV